MLRTPKLAIEVDEDAAITPFGGLILVEEFLRRFRVASRFDRAVEVLKLHLPYHESDHIITQALNLYVGGTCIEDQAKLQGDAGVLRMLKACRLPDPTTAGDFLRRFGTTSNAAALPALRKVIDELQADVWKKQRRHGRKHEWAVIDMDGHLKNTYGEKKEGADFTRKGKFGFHPLLLSMAGTGECLAVRLRPGNVQSYEGADEELRRVLPRVKKHHRKVLVRGDSHFDQREIREACEQAGVNFAFVSPSWSDRPGKAARIKDWRPFRTRAQRARTERESKPDFDPRWRKPNKKRMAVVARGYTNIDLARQWVAEIPHRPPGSDKTYRLIIRKQLLDIESGQAGQRELWQRYRYRFVISDLPDDWSAEEVIDATYQRCDQENLIEQMGSSLAMWRLPVAEFDGNRAWLEIARLAWNLRKWIEQLALPKEVRRWEWKRFRFAYVTVGAKVLHHARRVVVRLSGSSRFVDDLVAAHVKLQT